VNTLAIAVTIDESFQRNANHLGFPLQKRAAKKSGGSMTTSQRAKVFRTKSATDLRKTFFNCKGSPMFSQNLLNFGLKTLNSNIDCDGA